MFFFKSLHECPIRKKKVHYCVRIFKSWVLQIHKDINMIPNTETLKCKNIVAWIKQLALNYYMEVWWEIQGHLREYIFKENTRKLRILFDFS